MVTYVVVSEFSKDDKSSVTQIQVNYYSKQYLNGKISTTNKFPVPYTQVTVGPMEYYGDKMSNFPWSLLPKFQEGIYPMDD